MISWSTSATASCWLRGAFCSCGPTTNARAALTFAHTPAAALRNAKKTPPFPVAERLEMIRHTFRERGNVEADSFRGLLVDYASSRKATTIVRGVRAISDFEYEFQMALMNRRLA